VKAIVNVEGRRSGPEAGAAVTGLEGGYAVSDKALT